jgi:hypothetical protein
MYGLIRTKAPPKLFEQQLFAATGYTLRGPGGAGADASPQFVVFGRQRNV